MNKHENLVLLLKGGTTSINSSGSHLRKYPQWRQRLKWRKRLERVSKHPLLSLLLCIL